MALAFDSMKDKKNPSLKKYFTYMVNSRKLTIKFTPSKVREIILSDLQIDFQSFSELLQDVSIEMFTFYIQTWPGWKTEQFHNCIDHPDESYSYFKGFLKNNILKLKEKEHLYNKIDESSIDISGSNTVLSLPPDSQEHLPPDGSKRKIKFPYTLEIIANPKLFNSINIQVINGKTSAVLIENQYKQKLLSNVEVLNHPYVTVLFKLPGLIKFSRKNIHRIEMFLCKSTDSWHFPTQDRVVDIRKYPARDKVYSMNFLKMLFNNIEAAVKKCANKVAKDLSYDICCILNEFYKDIMESGYNTIQECTEICLSIGGSSYYSDSRRRDGPITVRKVYQPQVLYSLVFCGIEANDITENGLSYFQSLLNEDEFSEIHTRFQNFLTQCIHISCSMCNVHYKDMQSIKCHLQEVHNIVDVVLCTKCKQEGNLTDVISRRWLHECKILTSGSELA